jgi:DNA-directed RNA polymerase subunit F
MNPKILSETPVSMYDIKQELTKIKKRDTELNIRTTKTEEYLKNFAVLSQGDIDELTKELVALNVPRLKEQHICKIIDVLPEAEEELKVVLQGYALAISKDNTKKICDAVAKYSSHKK